MDATRSYLQKAKKVLYFHKHNSLDFLRRPCVSVTMTNPNIGRPWYLTKTIKNDQPKELFTSLTSPASIFIMATCTYSGTLVFAGGRPSSYFLFLWMGLRLPPVLRRLCQLSLEIPLVQKERIVLETSLRHYNTLASNAHLSAQFSKVCIRILKSDSAFGFIMYTQDSQ